MRSRNHALIWGRFALRVVRPLLAIPLLAGAVPAQQTPAQDRGRLSLKAVRQIEALLAAKAQRTPAQRKVRSQLLDAAGESIDERRQAKSTALADEQVMVDIRADISPTVLSRIQSLGGTVINSVSAREVYDQVNACSCPTLILACIVYWQAREISRLAAAPDFPFDPALLRHLSPSSGRTSSSTARSKSTPPSSLGTTLSVYFCTNLVSTLGSLTARVQLPSLRVVARCLTLPEAVWKALVSCPITKKFLSIQTPN